MNKKRGYKRVLCMLMTVMMICSSLYFSPIESLAAVKPVEIKVTYGQTEARGMLASINAFRTSEAEAWYWNESNSEKVMCQTTELQYDYELERIAMKRAAEIALSFAHTRPNQSDCFTAYTSSYGAMGENIAVGQNSANQVFAAWQESNEPYSGQGHRRNMLNSGFNAIGIGHVVYQGCHYWVQEFGDKVVDATPSAANDSTQVVNVDVDSSNITSVKTNLADVSLKVGEQATAEAFTLALTIRNYWGYQSECIVENTCTARIEDETIASLSDDLIITGLKEGTTKIWVSNPFGEEFYRTITVTKVVEAVEKTDITVDAIADQTYTGVAMMPEVVVKDGTTVLKKNVDYTVQYTNNIKVGTATVKITGKGAYEGSYTTNFKIVARSISESTVIKITDQTYTGKAITPSPYIYYKNKLLVKNTDYMLSYQDNTNVGTATVVITGKGNFEGTKTVTFNIVENAPITINTIPNKTYTGKEITPTITVKEGTKILTKNVDYTVSYSNNVNVGTATVTVTGIGAYEGTASTTFKIIARSIGSAQISKIADQTYTGKAITPDLTIVYNGKTLVKDTDYVVRYIINNVKVGIATMTIQGQGNFTGTRSIRFKIVENKNAIKISAISNKTYTGKEITPTVTVKEGTKTLVKNVDYTVSYTNNVNVGTATVTVTGIGAYQGSSSTTFKIVAKSIAAAQISKIEDQTYTGNAITPSITVVVDNRTLVKDTDYVVTYSNNVNVGTATIKIQGRGNYTGTRTVSFKIVKNDETVKEDETAEEDEPVVHTTRIKLSKSKVTLKVGKTYRLKVSVDAGSVDKISFKSSNKKVATVSSKGLIKAKRAGVTLITVTSGNKKKVCRVTVKK